MTADQEFMAWFIVISFAVMLIGSFVWAFKETYWNPDKDEDQGKDDWYL